jgi:hypothetical protein
MNKDVLSFNIPRVKRRDPLGLFVEDTPFKQKVVKRKDQFQRKPKHQNKTWDSE